jgi:hypothetical protein
VASFFVGNKNNDFLDINYSILEIREKIKFAFIVIEELN